jgi:hypothetical protein
MRISAILLALGLLLAPIAGGVQATDALAATSATAYVDQQGQPTPPIQVDVQTDRGAGAWYTSPVWIAIGVLAVIVILLLIIMAGRGGGTTVVRD